MPLVFGLRNFEGSSYLVKYVIISHKIRVFIHYRVNWKLQGSADMKMYYFIIPYIENYKFSKLKKYFHESSSK